MQARERSYWLVHVLYSVSSQKLLLSLISWCVWIDLLTNQLICWSRRLWFLRPPAYSLQRLVLQLVPCQPKRPNSQVGLRRQMGSDGSGHLSYERLSNHRLSNNSFGAETCSLLQTSQEPRGNVASNLLARDNFINPFRCCQSSPLN